VYYDNEFTMNFSLQCGDQEIDIDEEEVEEGDVCCMILCCTMCCVVRQVLLC